MVIGLGYRARSGKDTVAGILRERHGFQHTAFAAKLKHAAKAVFGLSTEQCNDLPYKEEVDPFWGLTPRDIVQRMGTEAMRGTFGPDVWIRALERTVTGYAVDWVISDVRFPNEAEAIQRWGGFVVRVSRRDDLRGTVGQPTHASETALAGWRGWDYVIDNNGTLEDLEHGVRTMLLTEQYGNRS